ASKVIDAQATVSPAQTEQDERKRRIVDLTHRSKQAGLRGEHIKLMAKTMWGIEELPSFSSLSDPQLDQWNAVLKSIESGTVTLESVLETFQPKEKPAQPTAPKQEQKQPQSEDDPDDFLKPNWTEKPQEPPD